MQQTTPAAPAVRETLERVLSSETFGRSERARRLLRYLVEREQAGEAERLKGFSIAMDVFGRDAGFNPSTDAVVRVQAGRLRELLAQYSAAEGAFDPVHITIPRGSYVPAYEHLLVPAEATAAPETAPPVGHSVRAAILPPEEPEAISLAPGEKDLVPPATPLPASPQVMRHLHFFWMAMGVVIAMLGFLVFRVVEPEPGASSDTATLAGDAPTQTSSITMPQPAESLPQIYISNKSAGGDAARVAALLRVGLSGFDAVDFIGHDLSLDQALGPDPTRFVFNVSTGAAEGVVSVELQNVATGKVLLSKILSAPDLDPLALDDRIADILSSTIPVSGAIYRYIEQNDLQFGLTACLLLNDNYYLDQTPPKHQAAYRCLEALTLEGSKSPLVYAEMASLHLEAVTDRYAYPPGATEEEAMELAHQALQMGVNSPYAHRAYGFITSRIGEPGESLRWMRKAYELNTYDLSMAAAYGYALVFSGAYKDAAPIMERAVEASSSHASWWDYGLFLSEFMLGDMEKAARATEALATANRSHYLAARIIAANSTGRKDLAARLVGELTTDFPNFVSKPRTTFENGKYPTALIEKLLEALRAAGVGEPS